MVMKYDINDQENYGKFGRITTWSINEAAIQGRNTSRLFWVMLSFSFLVGLPTRVLLSAHLNSRRLRLKGEALPNRTFLCPGLKPEIFG